MKMNVIPKVLIFLSLFFLFWGNSMAQDQGISYQAVARNAAGDLLQNQNITLEFRIREGGAGGSIVYQESHNVSSNDFGLFTAIIGKGNAISGTFSGIGWGDNTHFLEVVLDGQSLGTEEIQSVPYSKIATDMELDQLEDVDASLPLINDVLSWNGVSWVASTLNPGDTDPSDDITTSTSAGGDLSGTYPNPTVTHIQGQAVSTVNPVNDQVLAWSGTEWKGRSFPVGDPNPNDDITTSTSAGGDLSGNYPDPSVIGIQGNPVSNFPPNVGDVLKWNGTMWRPGPDIEGIFSINPSGYAEYDDDIRIGGGSSDYDGSEEYLGIRGRSEDWYIGVRNDASTTNSDLLFSTSLNTLTPAMRIEPSGDVGIGVDNPLYDLSIDGNLGGYANTSLKYLLSSTNSTGRGRFYGPSSTNVQISHLVGNTNRGFVITQNENSDEKASLFAGASDQGVVRAYGSNGNINAIMVSMTGDANRGTIRVYDANGNSQAGLNVNASGQGVVFADVKNFRMPHPEQADKEIWYASIEGPEAAAYARGTGNLQKGEALISFPDHFNLVANASTMTIILTPLSADSKGMAVIEKGVNGFKVKELWQGKGNYAFDWEVKAVRKGYENYRVIRDASEMKDVGTEEQAADIKAEKDEE